MFVSVDRWCAISLLAALLVASPAAAQRLAPWKSAELLPDVAVLEQDIPTSHLVIGSILGWTLGLVGGAGVGYLVESDPGDGWFGPAEWWLGAWVGSSIGAATGAHIANRGRGSLILGSLGSIVITPLALVAAVPLVDVAGFVLVPVAQIGVSVIVERQTGRN